MIVGIIGTGLMGGSIGMCARAAGHEVIGYDADAQAAGRALHRGAIDAVAARQEIDERAETIVIAAHTRVTIAELERLRDCAPPKARLILDISSVKAAVVRAAEGLKHFVATHPMAGSERSGPGAAVPDLFRRRTWLYVPTADEELNARARDFIVQCGGIPVPVDAAEHDRIVACTSHLPQVLATLFAQGLCAHDDAECYLGPAAHELVRLSRSNTRMWADILQENAQNVCRELRAFAERIEQRTCSLSQPRVQAPPTAPTPLRHNGKAC